MYQCSTKQALILLIVIFALTIMTVLHLLQEIKWTASHVMTSNDHQEHFEEIELVSSSSSKRYLYYYNNNGWSNQVIGLANAAQLAYSTNRTLILPPVLSHNTTNTLGNARTVYGRCSDSYKKSSQYIMKAKMDVNQCNNNHVKFSEIIDMTKLSARINVSFIDLCDFVKENPALVSKYFQLNVEKQDTLIDLVGPCTIRRKRSYPETIDYFQSIFAEETVAIIPSAFLLYNSDHKFNRKVMGYEPAPNLLKLMRVLRKSLSTNYIGVHLRYPDYHSFQCDSHSENKTEVLDMILRKQSSRRKYSKSSATINLPNVFIASNSQEAVKCYKDFLNEHGYQTFHLNDLFEEQKNAINLLPQIKAPTSVINLVLDQNFVSMGKRIVLVNRSGFVGFGSTFQAIITIRHEVCMNQLVVE